LIALEKDMDGGLRHHDGEAPLEGRSQGGLVLLTDITIGILIISRSMLVLHPVTLKRVRKSPAEFPVVMKLRSPLAGSTNDGYAIGAASPHR
jgi:hypothetical protein